METTRTYDNFPAWIVFVSNAVSLLIYCSGLLIISRLGWIPAGVYAVYILAFEYRLISRHCVNCWYWGKTCGFGRGRLSALFFRKGDPAKFCSKQMSWKDLIPDLFISLVPLLTGIILMIIDFEPIVLLAVVVIILLTTMGNGYVRGKLTCLYCRQREDGCPAEKLFSREGR